MGQQFEKISKRHRKFIEQQKMFFVGTATSGSRINISPKGMDSLRVMDENRVIWLNMTGSGNETSAHIQENSRMTIMLTAFEGAPMIMRLYGHAKVIHINDKAWDDLYSNFNPVLGARQIFDMSVDLVQTSCGYAVPLYDYKEDRTILDDWAAKKGEEGIRDYWRAKNLQSIDGAPTHIVEKNT